jgi:peptide/nickel transport system permease protein/oligopeptide transport system permease protein
MVANNVTGAAAAPKEPEKSKVTPWSRFKKHKPSLVGVVLIIVLILVATFAPLIAPANPDTQDLLHQLAKPGTPFGTRLGTGTFLLGSDHMGRDLFSRLVYGSRISLLVGFVSELVILAIGVPLGAMAGYYGGKVDKLIMRIADVMFAFPDLLFAIAIMFALGSGIINLFIALGIVGWAGMARLVRGQVLQLKEMDYVQAAKSAGARDWWVILRHILPNALGPIIVAVTLGIPGAIMSEASLSFLGLGVRPPTATWGAMIMDGRSYLRTAPMVSIVPGIAIMITVMAFNLVGDGLRDALDPRSNKKA